MTNEELVKALVEAAYESGYYSGKGEDGEEYHMNAIKTRDLLIRKVLARLDAGYEAIQQRAEDQELCKTMRTRGLW